MRIPVLWPRYPAIVPPWSARDIVAALAVPALRADDGRRFSRAFSSAIGRSGHATGSGRVALELALRAHGVTAGDEVIVPTFACSALVTATLRTGATPRFADVDRSLLMTPETVAPLVGPRTRAIVAVHNAGLRSRTTELRAQADSIGALLVEDCAQTSGLPVDDWMPGSDGHAAMYSFGAGKILMATAGGFLSGVGSDRAAALAVPPRGEAYARLLAAIFALRLARYTRPLVIGFRMRSRLRAEDRPGVHPEVSLSPVDAALLLSELRSLPAIQRARRENGRLLVQELERVDGISVPSTDANDFALFPITLASATRVGEGGRAPELAALGHALLRAGFEPEGTYTPLHVQYRRLHPEAECPIADELYWRTMSLPVRSGIPSDGIRAMASVVRDFLRGSTS